jgi:hypothetical protein
MLRQQKVPKYALHKPSGQARVTVDGERIYLGAFNSPASLQRYREIVARWRDWQTERAVPDISIGALALLYNEHFKAHYVKVGIAAVSHLVSISGLERQLGGLDRGALEERYAAANASADSN